MQSNVKTAGEERKKSFITTPFAGERERWEEYEWAIRLMIKRKIDVQTEWNDYLFKEFGEVPNRPDEYIIPAEFDVHQVSLLLALNAPPVAQKTRIDLIKVEKEYNAKVGKAISIHTCCDSLVEIYADRFSMEPYPFLDT
jgi:hypothetical protein